MRLFLLCIFFILHSSFSIAQTFTSVPLPDSVWALMQGVSVPTGSRVDRQSLRYLRLSHYDFEGCEHVGEMVCSQAVAADLLYIFRRLYEERYPIARMQLIDRFGADDNRSMTANNTSSFCYRRVAGSRRLSRHSLGMAVDVNPLYNPCVYVRSGKVAPVEGKPYATNRPRRRDIPGKIDHQDLCYRLFVERGWRWGGDWRTLKDYHHFEK